MKSETALHFEDAAFGLLAAAILVGVRITRMLLGFLS
jgi:hypothetical protein